MKNTLISRRLDISQLYSFTIITSFGDQCIIFE